TASLRLPANVALNGISGTAGGVYFAADSNSGSIYRLDLPMKRAEVWFRDDSYGPGAAGGVGISGVKARKDWVYFSSPARVGIYRIAVASDGKPMGAAPQVIEDGLRADDFDVAASGDVYFPSGMALYRASASAGVAVKFVTAISESAAAL